MAKISIPRQVIPGFELIASLPFDSIEAICTYLSQIPLNTKFKDIGLHLESIVGDDKSILLLNTINSFSELVEDKFDSETIKKIVTNLVESFIEITNFDNKEVVPILEKNLFAIISNYKNLKQIINCRDLAFENENVYKTSKIITDIRLSFIDADEVKKSGIVLQKFQIEYISNSEQKSIYLTLDLEDLNKLKVQIDEAILREERLKEDYKGLLNLI